MIIISMRFPAGRFHATPWGRHVNEAAAEWPPSPWRLLRALVATWKRTLADDPCCRPELVEPMLEALARPPCFSLPPASLGHTRHYMPWFKKGPDDRTLVFDAWVSLDKQAELLCWWPEARLEPAQLQALQAITTNLGSLGRAESWVEARAFEAEEVEPPEGSTACRPAGPGSAPAQHETVQVLCADPVLAFQRTALGGAPSTSGRSRRNPPPVYDPDWNLCVETSELHQHGFFDAPGSCWVPYLRATDSLAGQAPRPTVRLTGTRPTAVRFALDSPVLPLVQDTILVADEARRVAMGCYRRAEEAWHGIRADEDGADLPRSPVLSGKDEHGQPLAGHRHALYLPTDEDGDGHLDHLTIIAELGFGPGELRAFDRMHWLKRQKGEPVGLVLMAIGLTEALALHQLVGPARVWHSATPFVATRHAKTRGRKKEPGHLLGPENRPAFAGQVLQEELERLRQRRPAMPEPVRIEPLSPDHRCSARGLRPIQFKRSRRQAGDDGSRRAAGAFRIIFPGPVQGPICLGHGSHFGLGLFVPEPPGSWPAEGALDHAASP